MMPPQQLPQAGWQELILWILRRRQRLQVTGNSMLPYLQPGNVVFINRAAYRHRLPTPGDIVVARHPSERGVRIIKRVESVTPEGDCFVVSDNSIEGTDSRAFGTIAADKIIGRVTSKT